MAGDLNATRSIVHHVSTRRVGGGQKEAGLPAEAVRRNPPPQRDATKGIATSHTASPRLSRDRLALLLLTISAPGIDEDSMLTRSPQPPPRVAGDGCWGEVPTVAWQLRSIETLVAALSSS
eukprot:1131018-Rhodomonas_salina.1